jgi:chemotaxis protein histidine kinase CheA
MTKKPALLSESLLAHRPRKGEAKPQTETQASEPDATPASERAGENAAPARRRKRRSQNTQQLNLRVSEETLERFTNLADAKNLIFGDLLALLLNEFDKK